jgi:hypothetical protein
MTLKIIFFAAVGLGFGSALAAWVVQQTANAFNAFLIVTYNTIWRRKASGAFVPCVMCGQSCDTVLQCTSPACGHIHFPNKEPEARRL